MSDNTGLLLTLIVILLFSLLVSGDPDLLDAIISQILVENYK